MNAKPIRLALHHTVQGFTAALFLLIALASYGLAQQASPAPDAPPATQQEFLRAADEILAEVSQHIGLPLKSPLKKSLRSREEIRKFVEEQIKEAAQTFKNVLEAAASFGGEEVLELQ